MAPFVVLRVDYTQWKDELVRLYIKLYLTNNACSKATLRLVIVGHGFKWNWNFPGMAKEEKTKRIYLFASVLNNNQLK